MIRQHLLLSILALTTSVCAAPLSGLSAADVNGPAAVAPLEHPQPPARLIVDPPLPGPLSKGAVFIQYRGRKPAHRAGLRPRGAQGDPAYRTHSRGGGRCAVALG